MTLSLNTPKHKYWVLQHQSWPLTWYCLITFQDIIHCLSVDTTKWKSEFLVGYFIFTSLIAAYLPLSDTANAKYQIIGLIISYRTITVLPCLTWNDMTGTTTLSPFLLNSSNCTVQISNFSGQSTVSLFLGQATVANSLTKHSCHKHLN